MPSSTNKVSGVLGELLEGGKSETAGSVKDYREILKGDPCAYCGAPGIGEADHIEPHAAGGSGRWENLTAACWYCNHTKLDAPLLPFLLDYRDFMRDLHCRRTTRSRWVTLVDGVVTYREAA